MGVGWFYNFPPSGTIFHNYLLGLSIGSFLLDTTWCCLSITYGVVLGVFYQLMLPPSHLYYPIIIKSVDMVGPGLQRTVWSRCSFWYDNRLYLNWKEVQRFFLRIVRSKRFSRSSLTFVIAYVSQPHNGCDDRLMNLDFRGAVGFYVFRRLFNEYRQPVRWLDFALYFLFVVIVASHCL